MAEQQVQNTEAEVVDSTTAGAQFVRKIGPFGIIFFLAIFAFFLYWCFTDKPDNLLPGYTAPETSEYYSEHIDELQTELEANVLPRLPGFVSDEVENGVIVLTFEADNYFNSRYSILEYYDETLFVFERSEN